MSGAYDYVEKTSHYELCLRFANMSLPNGRLDGEVCQDNLFRARIAEAMSNYKE